MRGINEHEYEDYDDDYDDYNDDDNDDDDYYVIDAAHYDDAKKTELLTNPGIIRNKLKIESSIINANAFIKVSGLDMKPLKFEMLRHQTPSTTWHSSVGGCPMGV